MKNTIKILLFLCALIMAYYTFGVIRGFMKLSASSSQGVVFPKITNTYSEIFRSDFKQYIEPSFTYYTNGKSPVATFKSLKNDRVLLVYALNIKGNNYSVDSIFKVPKTNFNSTVDNIIYNRCFNSGFSKFYDAKISLKPAKSVYLNISGDILSKQSISDSLVLYKTFASKLNFQYIPNSIIDFFFEDTSLINPKKNLIIAIYKTRQKFYIILELPNTKNTNVNLEPLLPKILQR